LFLLETSKKPVIIAGSGIRLSNSPEEFLSFAEKFNIPITTTFNAHDIVNSDHPLYIGRQGTIGDRSGNFAVENSDLLIILGSRLNIRQIGYNFDSFSPNSKKVMVDIDKEELNKKTLKIDVKINTDLKHFFSQAKKINITSKNENYTKFILTCKDLQNKYPVIKPEFYRSKKINPYVLMSIIHNFSENSDTFVTSDGSAAVMSSQALKIKNSQRLFSNSGSASMGYGLPAAIGASIASKNRIICIEGDGSIQMNIQELETVKYNNLNLKIIIIENGGYLSIKQTQKRFFNKEIATGPNSGLGIPQLKKVCKAYDISCSQTSTIKSTKDAFKKHYYKKYPHVFIVSVDKSQGFEPKPSSKRLPNGKLISTGLDDMAPHLSSIELEKIRKLLNF
jgi:acetolactate synthase-1/2/3 large subunit